MSGLGWAFFIAFFIWSFPVGVLRSRWRKMVYQTDSWLINIQPYFWKELKILFGFQRMEKPEQQKLVNYFRVYLLVYFLLLFGWLQTR